MVTANCASDALDACDPTEFGGTSSEETDEWFHFLSMDNDGGASEKLTGLPTISEAEAQALETNSDYCYHELVRLVESGGVSTVSNLFPAYGNTECLNPLLVSAGDNYLEINDIFPLGETASFDLSAPGNLFTQYPLEQFPYSELNRPQYDNDGALSASLVAGDFFAPISCSMHDTSVDHIICTTNFVLNDSSNSTMQDPFS
ncbi:uncharacterized protein [Miscanthus floridulus]|uniref:uncharacterized protein n=1 Tax=Miscanthus floridulus TaxID=154761 RepID=UPI0034584816